jgi:hypothetical protein
MSQVRRSVGAFVLAAVVASGLVFTPAPAQAFDICAQLDANIASVQAGKMPQFVKDGFIASLNRLKEAYGCNAAE